MDDSLQRKHRRQKSTNNERDSVVIDDSLNLTNYSSIKSNLRNVEQKLNQEVSHLHKNKQKLVSVIDRKFICSKCDKQYTDTSSLRRHKASAHEGVRYPCDECNAGPFIKSSSLWKHTASVHKGVVYPCDQCNAGPFSQAANLREHKASAHEGVRYPCDKCNSGPFTMPSTLRRHTASAHEGVVFPCSECNAGPFTDKSALRIHINAAHKGVRLSLIHI